MKIISEAQQEADQREEGKDSYEMNKTIITYPTLCD
jgi:hypothetical protein